MYHIYGKHKNGLMYRLVDANSYEEIETSEGQKKIPYFEYRKIRSTLIDSWEKAERICYELEKEFSDYIFESRKA